MDIVVRRGGLLDAPNQEYRYKSILLNVTHLGLHGMYTQQMQVDLRGGGAEHDGLPLSPRRASVNLTLVRDMRPSMTGATNLRL